MDGQPRASSHPLAGVSRSDAFLLGTMIFAFVILTGLMVLFAPSIVGFAGLGITFVLGLVPTVVSAMST